MHDATIDRAREGSTIHRSKIRAQRLAFGVIRALSFLTLAILAIIVGFIVFKGLRYGNQTRSSVLPASEAAPEGLAVVVHADTDLRVLEFPVLFGMFTDEYINWAKISEDKHDLLPVAVDPASPDGKAAETFLFGDPTRSGGLSPWGGLVKTVPDAAAALALVASTPGAVAIVPAAEAAAASAATSAAAGRGGPGFATVPLRRILVAINPEAAALEDNRLVDDLDDAAIARLMLGKVASWKELGGPDLPVMILAPPAGSSLAASLAAAGLRHAGFPPAKDMASYVRALLETPGAAGYLFAGEAAAAGLPNVTRKGVESGWNLNLRYLVEAPRLSGRVGGISTIILNTLFMLALTVAMAAPIGIAAAVYLVEYARQGILVRILRLGTETLAGIPSIIFGLFGMLFFVTILRFGFGLLSGCLTLTLMILPTIVRTSEEALKAVPASLREGSLALGATKLQTVFRVAVPAAAPGILAGLILGVGRAAGETAALLFTMGSGYELAKGLFSSTRVLSAHVYLLFAEGISFDRAYSTATVLIAVVLVFNLAAKRLIGKMGRSAGN